MIEQLYMDYYEQILRYLVSLSKNYALAEDITQETFLRAMANVNILEELETQKCRAWLYRTAKNIFIDKVRREKREAEAEEEGVFEEDFSIVMVEQLCNYLTDEEKAMFWLRYMEGYNATELGEIFNMPPSTIRAKLASAKRKLAEQYRK